MSEILQQLREDHRNVALMMELLESQLDAVHEMENADFELMHDVMRYMTHYPDRVHHPKEDLMFERIRADEPFLAKTLEDLRREHGALLERGERFLTMLRQVVDGAMVERVDLESLGRDYVAFMRHHMRKEDHDVFPAAESQLSDDDWSYVANTIEAQADPVFGPIASEQFQALLTHIRRRSGKSV